MLTISLRHQGKPPGAPLRLPATTALADVHTAILAHLSLPPDTSLRLLSRGRLLTDARPLASLPSPCTLYVLSTSSSAISSVRAARPDPLVRPFSRPSPRYVAAPRATPRASASVASASAAFGFGRTEALPGFADHARAAAILEQLATDRGFLDVMKRKGWRVGALKEMPPEGKVGVDPVCVLGYNTGKGMEIHLRLRTDDRMGFRPMRMIRQVLAHELAHNVFSEHDDRFKELMRWIEREAGKMDWRSGGDTVAGGRHHERVEGVDPLQEATVDVGATTLGFVGRLGSSEGAHSAPAARSVVGVAGNGFGRDDVEMTEQEANIRQSSTHDMMSGQSQELRAVKRDIQAKDEVLQPIDKDAPDQNCKPASSPVMPPKVEPQSDAAASSSYKPHMQEARALSAPKPVTAAVDQLTALGFNRGLATLALRENGLNASRAANWLFSMTPSASEEETAGESEHNEEVDHAKRALRRLCASGLPAEQLRSVLDALHLYLSNALRNPKAERFSKINATNAGFQRRVGAHGEATAVLEAAGFRLDGGAWKYEDRDSGRLWVTKNIVQDRLVKELTR
ncbi:unnamed protein product [Chondrus crispus]|uniref:WLM domain-containing protein n=1 Tax=Chondrus crispus TaxID=2769 RepID=R7Q9G2_CHOCR|nr:unnamed protein product [Chondrus crispus]CDF34428.1 unnamed protein product [Chondrus crispus]|eukprot:XP_005714247.1 unnamed protein product [Chondrus crispus]